MPKTTHHILASYDIRDAKRLQRVAKIMKGYGERVLKSVFECHLEDVQFQRMKDRIEQVVDHTEDSVRFYSICDKCLERVEVSGLGQGFVQDEEIHII